MKKIILIALLPITIIMAGSFVMTEGNPLIKADTTVTTDSSPVNTNNNTSNWTPKALPTQKFNVLDYGLKGDGVTDDSAALKNLAKNTSITNWYFPAGIYLLSRVNVPSHVVAIHGIGTIISKGYTGDSNPEGAFNINNTGNQAATNLIIDGLDFKRGTGFDGGEAYGQITIFQYGGNTSGIEIRNCSFDSTNFKSDCIAAFAESDGSMTHDGMRIYNNTFTNIQAIAVELFDKQIIDNAMGFTNTHVYSNTFTNGSGMAISMAGIRQNFYIYENTFTNIGWGIETAECDKGEIYNNYGTSFKSYSFTDSIKWNGPFASPGVIKVHHNHFTANKTAGKHGGTFLLYNGGKAEVYENYIHGAVFVKIDDFGDGPTNTIMGNIHDNTIVLDFAHEWTNHTVVISQVSEGSMIDNDIYNTLSGKHGITTSTSGQTYSNNNIYVNGGSCINGASQSGGSCNNSYSGTPPTSRPGAGL